ncbi:MAG TPA: ribosomal protein S18-alanine N-acetyltransferase [Methanoregulaceae archaeon]|nr:ribosomal protein S18-alanine N-acetyltransferase [Methanoregulaceae archaeon]
MRGELLQIRRARASDLPFVATIERASFPDPWDEATLEWVLEYCGDFFFVASSGEALAGFLAGALEETGVEVYGHICNFAVAPEFRGRGIGRRLVARAEQQFLVAGASAVQLEVRESNLAARAFYSRCGYREVLCIPAYYANGEDARLMMRWLY